MSCGHEGGGILRMGISLKKEWEKLNPQAQKSLVDFMLSLKGGKLYVSKALTRGLSDPELIKNYVRGSDFVLDAMKKAFGDPTFVLFFSDSLGELSKDKDKATSYGLKVTNNQHDTYRRIDIL
ncbi:MAG: hypothetical protein FWG55_05545 [Candidatus Bathyarchaeota archaeon]|nr:hypothetical protein [Candidatus Termiticorpusculum sp.]